MNISYRNITETDFPFIFATWLKGLYHGNSYYRKINQDLFYKKYHKILEYVLNGSTVYIACMEDEPDVILGYSVFSGTTLHWVFVKKAWRKLGIGKNLLPQQIERVSHISKLGETLMKQKELKWIYDPFLF